MEEEIKSACILITRNEGFGKISKATREFFDKNKHLVKVVVVNGDKRFGPFFCAVGAKIIKKYGIPVIRNIEKEGNEEDVANIKKYLNSET